MGAVRNMALLKERDPKSTVPAMDILLLRSNAGEPKCVIVVLRTISYRPSVQTVYSWNLGPAGQGDLHV